MSELDLLPTPFTIDEYERARGPYSQSVVTFSSQISAIFQVTLPDDGKIYTVYAQAGDDLLELARRQRSLMIAGLHGSTRVLSEY